MADEKRAEPRKVEDSGEREVARKVNEAAEQGFHGTAVDERPREDYTLEGSVRRAGENLDN